MNATVAPRRHGWRFVVGGWLASRIFLFGMMAFIGRFYHRNVAQMVINWDAAWYDHIATHGYDKLELYAFMPGFPLVLRAGLALGIQTAWTGIAVSTACSLIAALALWRIGGEKYGPWMALLWCFAPMTVFTSIVYTESLFCAFAFWAWERMLRGKWWQMAVLVSFACMIRISGLFLLAAIGVYLLLRVRADAPTLRQRLLPLLWLLLPIGVVVGYAGYLASFTGDWMFWYTAQTSGWERKFTWPWQTLKNTWQYMRPGAYATEMGLAWIHRFETASLFLGLAVSVVCLLRKRWGEAVFVAIQVVGFGTAHHLMAVNRAVLLWFPWWLILAQIVVKRLRDRLVMIIFWAVDLFLVAWWCWLFYQGLWAS